MVAYSQIAFLAAVGLASAQHYGYTPSGTATYASGVAAPSGEHHHHHNGSGHHGGHHNGSGHAYPTASLATPVPLYTPSGKWYPSVHYKRAAPTDGAPADAPSGVAHPSGGHHEHHDHDGDHHDEHHYRYSRLPHRAVQTDAPMPPGNSTSDKPNHEHHGDHDHWDHWDHWEHEHHGEHHDGEHKHHSGVAMSTGGIPQPSGGPVPAPNATPAQKRQASETPASDPAHIHHGPYQPIPRPSGILPPDGSRPTGIRLPPHRPTHGPARPQPLDGAKPSGFVTSVVDDS